MTMWRPNEPAEEGVSNLPGVDFEGQTPPITPTALGVTGLLTKPSFRFSKMSGPTERSSAPLSRVLILDQ
jgi:hypothetical protein